MARIASLSPRRRMLLNIGGCPLLVEVARTPVERWLGLSGRDCFAEDRGMIFIFPAPDRHSFWMRGVPFGLTVAFVRDTGGIVALVDMEPMSDAHVASPEPVRLALEAPRGWFARRGIKPGAKASIVASST